MGMDKIGLCVFEIGLNVKPFGFRIQGITTGLIKIPFSFFTVIASKTDIGLCANSITSVRVSMAKTVCVSISMLFFVDWPHQCSRLPFRCKLM